MAEYKQDLDIDQNSLDREFIRQPNLYMKYSELFIQADREAKDAKERLEVVKAQLYSDIIKREEKKPTENMIQSWIALSDIFQKAQRAYYDKRYEADILASAVKSFEHKRSSLENLARLWIGSYYSSPKQTSEVKETIQEKRSERQRRHLNK